MAFAVGSRRGGAEIVNDPFWLVVAGFFGLCIGSFLNVVIYRLPLGQSLATPPSRCRKCGYSLRWFDNVPVVSWALLRGRCRKCGVSVSWQYPLVELITAALFVLVVWLTPIGTLLASRLLLVCILIALFGIDLEHQILPNSITLPGIVIGLLFSLVAPPGWKDALIGALLGAGILYAIACAYYLWRREEGMGMGDVKMLAMLGAFLGWKAVLVTVILASFAGAFIGVAMMASRMPSIAMLAKLSVEAFIAGTPNTTRSAARRRTWR